MSDAQQLGMTTRLYVVQSYAKINLTLDVLGKREDGYHDLATIMQSIDLYDTLALSLSANKSVQIICTQPELSTNNNLAVRAAQLLRERLSLSQGVIIELHKRIPVAAGLGGGSSNAAAVLLALHRWWQSPLTSAELLELATQLGSDVPFFLTEGLALCEGRGERVTPLPSRWPLSMRWLLLLKPSISVSTAAVFRSLPASDYTDASHSQAIRSALISQNEIDIEHLHNGLERGVLERYPEVARAQADLLHAGARLVRLSGSGPTLFAPFSDLAEATRIQRHLQQQGYELYLTHAIASPGQSVSFY